MCGLAVAISLKQGHSIREKGVLAMRDALKHRGPDAEGSWFGMMVGMGHVRLSIVDTKSPPQPYHLDELVVVFNGEVYNHNELRDELVARGYIFKSRCDTDVVLAAFHCWGEASFARLDGMFAFVIYNKKTCDMWVCRDRFGIKPLYMREVESGNVVVLSSELPSLLAYKDSGSCALNPRYIEQYMTLGFNLEDTGCYDGIKQLPPGQYIKFTAGSKDFTFNVYFEPRSIMMGKEHSKLPSGDDGEFLLVEAVRSQMVADVEVGTFLSGGVDSSFITSISSRISDNKIKSFSAGFNLPDFDETPESKILSKEIGVEQFIEKFGSEMLLNAGLVIDIYGEPFADNAALPTYALAKMAADNNIKVVLSGDGADELFFGYRNHRSMFIEEKIKHCLPKFMKASVFPFMGKYYPHHPSMPRFMRAQSTFESLGMSLPASYCSAMGVTSRRMLDALYSKEFKSQLQGYRTEHSFEMIAADCEFEDPMKVIQYLDLKTYLPGSILKKVDRATMKAGVEARVPFLSNDLSVAALSTPSSFNLGLNANKAQVRKWSTNWLPEEFKNRAKKSFTSPLDQWFRCLQYERFCRIIMSESLMDSQIFDIKAVQRLMDMHYKGELNCGSTLWSLAVMSKFLG
jgi:asparagine synthase (glutamine-hydrolysing)